MFFRIALKISLKCGDRHERLSVTAMKCSPIKHGAINVPRDAPRHTARRYRGNQTSAASALRYHFVTSSALPFGLAGAVQPYFGGKRQMAYRWETPAKVWLEAGQSGHGWRPEALT
jgi:hypothetical protein